MRTLSFFLATALSVTAALDVDIKNVISSLAETDPVLAEKKLDGLKVRYDQAGCYDITQGELAIELCEDEVGARKPLLNTETAKLYSWVNGTVQNVGAVAACNVAFASRGTDLIKEAIETVPANLPTTAMDVPPLTTIDLAPTEKIDFAFLLPFDGTTNSPVFVGFADTITACEKAVASFVPEMVKKAPAGVVEAADKSVEATETAADSVVDEAQEQMKSSVDTLQAKANAMLDNVQDLDMLKRTNNGETTTPAGEEETGPVAAGEAKAYIPDQEEAAAAPATPEKAPSDAAVQEPAVSSTSAAGTLNYSSMLFLGMIAVASFVALLA